VTFGLEPQQNGAQHLRRCMTDPQENDVWHLRLCMIEPQKDGAEPQKRQRQKKTFKE